MGELNHRKVTIRDYKSPQKLETLRPRERMLRYSKNISKNKKHKISKNEKQNKKLP